jgi:hypothetical protein
MTQALYEHMNNKRKKRKRKRLYEHMNNKRKKKKKKKVLGKGKRRPEPQLTDHFVYF